MSMPSFHRVSAGDGFSRGLLASVGVGLVLLFLCAFVVGGPAVAMSTAPVALAGVVLIILAAFFHGIEGVLGLGGIEIPIGRSPGEDGRPAPTQGERAPTGRDKPES